MSGTRIFWKESRIFKILAVIIPLPFLLLSFLLGAVEVQADSYIPSGASDFNFVDLSGISNSRSLSWNLKPSGVIDDQNQFYTLDYDATDDVYSLDVAPTTASVYVQYVGNISIRSVYSATEQTTGYNTAMFWGTESLSLSFSNPPVGNVGSMTAVVDNVTASSNYNLNIAPRISNQGRNSCTITSYIGCSYSPWFNQVEIVYNMHVTVLVPSTAVSNVNSQIAAMINAFPNVALSGSSSSSVRWAVTEYSLYEILNTFDAKLYNIWVADNLIYDELRRSGAANNFANSLSSQMGQEAAQAHSDSVTINNNLMNDSTNFSTNQGTLKNDIDVKQQAADVAVDGALHQYDSDLDTVTDFQWKNFFTSQSGAATFWRDVGEYILNSSNLGFIATGLAIVTIVTLFVFLLRL